MRFRNFSVERIGGCLTAPADHNFFPNWNFDHSILSICDPTHESNEETLEIRRALSRLESVNCFHESKCFRWTRLL
jgi:hypothetical protein